MSVNKTVMFSFKEVALFMVIFASSVDAQYSLLKELSTMDVLVTEMADSCKLANPNFKETMMVHNRAFYLSESGDHSEAIECYLSLLEAGESKRLIYEGLSISYSRTRQCDKAQEMRDKHRTWMAKFFGGTSEGWEDPQTDTLNEELLQCRAAQGAN